MSKVRLASCELRGSGYPYVFVDPDVLLRVPLKPNNVAGRGTHYHIDVVWPFRERIDVVT